MTLLISQLNRFWMSRRLMRLWVKGRTVRIGAGVGRGLFFDAGVSNPDYALGLNELPVQKMFSWHIKPGDVVYDLIFGQIDPDPNR